jgi:hypothetical protein
LFVKVPSTVPRLLINRQEVGKKHDDTDGKKGGFRFRTRHLPFPFSQLSSSSLPLLFLVAL